MDSSGEREAVRLIDAFGHNAQRPRWVAAIDVGRQLGLRLAAFVEAEDAEGRIGEPDRAVGLADEVVGRVELLALECLRNGGDDAVALGTRNAPATVLAGQQAAVPVARIAVGMARGLAGGRSRRRFPRPSAGCSCRARRSIAGGASPNQTGPRPSASGDWGGRRGAPSCRAPCGSAQRTRRPRPRRQARAPGLPAHFISPGSHSESAGM